MWMLAIRGKRNCYLDEQCSNLFIYLNWLEGYCWLKNNNNNQNFVISTMENTGVPKIKQKRSSIKIKAKYLESQKERTKEF